MTSKTEKISSSKKHIYDDLFCPRNIAVAGASNTPGKMGNLFVQHLLDGYSGGLYLVHPTEKKIEGIAVHNDLAVVPEPIDLLIALIPQEQMVSLLHSCLPGRVKFLLAIPSGFGEVSPQGKKYELELLQMARERGIRVIGPNIMGLLNSAIGLNASMAPFNPRGGAGFSCVTQSGGFGMAINMYLQDHPLKMAKFCDLGNTSDVPVDKILDYYFQDEDTRIISIFLESIGQKDEFIEQIDHIARSKPVICTLLGRSTDGLRASEAHLGHYSDNSRLDIGKETQHVIPARAGLEMLHITKGLSWQPVPKGRRVAILTGSGGIGAELVDLCVENGLQVPEFSERLQSSLRPHLPSYASVRNPVDLTPVWWQYPDIYPPLIRELSASEEVDILIVGVLDVATTIKELAESLAECFTNGSQQATHKKSVYVYWASTNDMMGNMRILENAHIPCYRSTLETVRTAAAISHYGARTTMDR
ncbi:MAG: CoA-binding protein [Deltaproteobacteria bacterium]|nr:CoA-binding protein [Deltaproteobacteria bacterium]